MRKKKYYILDCYFKKYYGPYNTKKDLNKDIKIVRILSDMFLEAYTNVITMEIDDNFSGAFINEHFEKDIICHT